MANHGTLVELKADLEHWALASSLHGGVATGALFISLMGLFLLSPVLTPLAPWYAAGIMAAYLLALSWTAQRYWQATEDWCKRLTKELPASGLLERIALEALPGERAIDHVAIVVRLLFPRWNRRKATLRSELEMVGTNLEWYLKQPSPLIKAGWFGAAFWLSCSMASLVLPLVWRAGGHQPAFVTNWSMMLSIGGYVLGGIPCLLMQQREMISKGILATELLKRLRLMEQQRVTDPATRAALGLPDLPNRAKVEGS